MRYLFVACVAGALSLTATAGQARTGADVAPQLVSQAWRPSAASESRWGLTQDDWLKRPSKDLIAKAKRSRHWRTVQADADAGDTDAAALMAFDLGNAGSLGLAAGYAKTAAAGGNPRGLSYYGLALAQGVGVTANPAEAESLLVRSRDLGNLYALVPLGLLYFGKGPRFHEASAALYKQAADADVPDGLGGYAWFVETGSGGVAKDPDLAIELYEKAGERGLPAYFTKAGYILMRGDLGSADPSRAAEFFQRGAAEGDAKAMAEYTNCLINGYGLDKDPAEAMVWAAKSAAAGNREGKYLYGTLLLGKPSTSEDLALGRQLLQEAADAGHRDAAFDTALMAYQGSSGATQNDGVAVKYFMMASKAGNVTSAFNVGVLLESRLHDREGARTWFQKAKDLGYAKADAELVRLAAEDKETARLASLPARATTAAAPSRAASATPARGQALVDANGAPTAAGILRTVTALAARGDGLRQTSIPGEIVSSIPFFGDTLRMQRGVSDVSCRRKAKGVYRCSYVSTVETLPVEGNSLAAFAGLLTVGFSQSMGTNVTRASRTYDFIRTGSGWSSPQLDAVFRQDDAARAQARTSARRDPDTSLQDNIKRQNETTEVINNLREAWDTKY
ncbi:MULTISPECIES: tetratricopeptide repeat protein [unclassified Caulobacter]|uniref:tetratricopeptide repeat protein n=1 Tax=unclassified Caulobacter TaxID=2648921 RepID=UPI0006F9EBC7|nr:MULTISPECIES: tetratricopeptide repeat protein [unclassified Caulobacter]KQV54923.1 hypothetical protein ASC62_22855 [Caulobacter sp. Root342]KQV68471.1 hypothetical protein ASC70_06330 [Caulobacter sp. Root343]